MISANTFDIALAYLKRIEKGQEEEPMGPRHPLVIFLESIVSQLSVGRLGQEAAGLNGHSAKELKRLRRRADEIGKEIEAELAYMLEEACEFMEEQEYSEDEEEYEYFHDEQVGEILKVLEEFLEDEEDDDGATLCAEVRRLYRKVVQ